MIKYTQKCIDGIKQNREQIEPFLYVCSVAFCFQGSTAIQVAVAGLWILRAFYQLLMDYRAERISFRIKDCVFAIVMLLLPQLLIHLYTIVLTVLDLTRGDVLSTNLVTYAAILFVVVSLYLFEEKAMWYIFYALALSWFIYLVRATCIYGPRVIVDAIAQGWFDVSLGHENYLELDAVVLSAGYGILLFLCSSKERNQKNRTFFIMLLIAFLVGIKRISILAVLLVAACYWLVRRMDEKKAYKLSLVAGAIAAVICVAFIFVLSLGDVFYEFVDKLGVDVMARDFFYKHIMKRTEFSPLFLGFGRGSVKVVMLQRFPGYSYVHSDIIKMYFELGFVLFFGWLYFNLIFVTKFFKKHYSESAAVFYMLTSAYTFVQFMTDNTESYFVCIIVRSIVVMGYAMATKDAEQGGIRKL